MSDTVGELVVKVTADTKEMTNAIQGDAEKAGKNFAQKMGAGMKGLAVAGVAAGAAAATGLAIVGKQAIETASDLNETATKVDQLFGEEGSAQIKEWSQTTAETMGQSALAAQNAAADFAIFGKVAGLAGQDLVDFSKDNTRLASDLASFFNTEPAEAAQAIASALRGESEPMRKYGVIINDAALKQAYFEETGEKVTGTLTGQQKALAANRVIWDQTKDAQDDFARTSDGLANSQRTLAATLEDVKSVVGQGLLPAVTTIVQAIGPLAKDLQEPLANIASVIGEQLASAFETLSPLLGPLAEALTSLGGSVLKAVISAVKALVPAITPLLSIFAQVGERLGPLLEKILGKVAEVLVELFGAATPVIDVLFDLAFEILDALWPIVEVVVDTMIDLVKAFTPLLRAVTLLLPPFVMLINTVFKVIMPILKPLLPVFVAFAEVMGDLMVRAVGGLMLAFGKFLDVMGDISPFIRDKVVKPTIAFITVWAGKMVEGAVVAFGWVPGLDKKLEGAAKAVENFGKDAEDAIHQAFVETAADAKAMGQEMADIGQDLVDNGAASQAYEAGREIGRGVALGMEAGIKNNSIQAQVAAINMVKGVEYDSKAYLQQNSPSKRFITIGEGVVEGFVKGLEKGGVSEAMVKTLSDGTEAALDSLQELLNEAKRMLDKSEQDYRQYALNVKAALIGDAANPAIAMEKTQMQAQNLADAQERLNELRAQKANGRKISDEQFAEAEADVRAAEAAAKSFEENFQAGIDLSSAFANALNEAAPVIAAQFDLTTPEGRRMYDTMIQNIAAAGPEVGLATAQAISAGLLSPDAFNDLKTLDALAGDVGVAVFATSKEEGRKYGKEMIKGIKAQIKASEKALKKIGRDAGNGMVSGLRSTIKDWVGVIQEYVKGTKVTLQINSPSKVFEKIGEQTGQGFTNGFAKTADSPINPPGGMRTRAYSADTGSLSGGDTNVKVFIGDRELTDIVDVQVERNQDNMARSLMLGRY